MRGGSVVGAVLVVALLSAAAIAIDSAAIKLEGRAQVAATEATSVSTTGQTAAKDESTSVTGSCELGYDYVIRVDREGKTQISFAKNDANGRPTIAVSEKAKADASRCPTAGVQANDGTGRTCTEAGWECRVAYCQPKRDANGVPASTVNSPNQETCMTITKRSKVGEKIDSNEKKQEANTDAGKLVGNFSASAEERESAKEFLNSGDSADGKALLESYDQQYRDRQLAAELETAKQDRDAAQARRDEIQRKLNGGLFECGVKGYLAGERCGYTQSDLEKANLDLAQREAQLKELSAARGGLAPKQPDNCIPGTGGCQNIPSTPAPQPPPAQSGGREVVVYRDSFGGGGGGQGVYVYPNQGAQASGGQQGCNSNQGMGGGGIFGAVISLVMRGIGGGNSGGNTNSGCNNNGNGSNMPTPSCTITATPRTVGKGDVVTLSWQSERGFSAILSSSGSVAPSGSVTVNPQTTTTYSLQINGYIDNRTGQQLRGECSTQVIVDGEGGGTGSPKAEISCRPEVADVGMQVAVSFACANSSVSAGNGFSTDNQMSGSATPTIENPTIGTTNAIFGVTCSKEGKTDTAQCTVAINKTSMVLIANPKNIESGAQANVGWVTSGMQECTISSPTLSGFTAENAGNTATSGVAKTPVLEADAEFELTCTTKSGVVKTAKTTVVVE